jgi:hypothetical protein
MPPLTRDELRWLARFERTLERATPSTGCRSLATLRGQAPPRFRRAASTELAFCRRSDPKLGRFPTIQEDLLQVAKPLPFRGRNHGSYRDTELSKWASRAVNREVHVNCWAIMSWARIERETAAVRGQTGPQPLMGLVWFGQGNTVQLPRYACDDLRRLQKNPTQAEIIFGSVDLVTLGHELGHVIGGASEYQARCGTPKLTMDLLAQMPNRRALIGQVRLAIENRVRDYGKDCGAPDFPSVR